jgi:dTDP-4-dehydrorhamnose reductase
MGSRRRVLVTGGSGYLGQHLLEHLALDESIDLAYTYSTAALPVTALRIETPFHMDLTDDASIKAVISQFQPHIVVHTAAQVS